MGDSEMPAGLDWVKLREDMDAMYTKRKPFTERFLQNPLIPIGALLTVAALCNGLGKFLKGDKEGQQRMMRYRIGAQLFTVLVAAAGGYLFLPKEKKFMDLFSSEDEVMPKD